MPKRVDPADLFSSDLSVTHVLPHMHIIIRLEAEVQPNIGNIYFLMVFTPSGVTRPKANRKSGEL